MAARQRPAGLMSPSGPHGMSQPSVKRAMAPQGIMGPGMRPRGPVPQPHQYPPNFPPPPQQQQPQQPHPMDIKKLGMKLGGSISITSSEASFSGGAAAAQPSAIRRVGGPSTSRMHSSSPKSSDSAASRASSLPQRHLSQEQPVEVKMEPMDDMYEEGEEMPEDYEEEGFGDEEEEEEEEDDEEFEQEGMYPGEPPYDDDVVHDGAGYPQ